MTRSHALGCPWWSAKRLQDALREHEGDKNAVAAEFGTTSVTIENWIERHGLDEFTYGDSGDGSAPSQNEVQ